MADKINWSPKFGTFEFDKDKMEGWQMVMKCGGDPNALGAAGSSSLAIQLFSLVSSIAYISIL